MQNVATRLKPKKCDHVILRELHWLPIDDRILFRVLLTYKSLNTMGQSYLKACYQLPLNLRSVSDPLALILPKTGWKCTWQVIQCHCRWKMEETSTGCLQVKNGRNIDWISVCRVYVLIQINAKDTCVTAFWQNQSQVVFVHWEYYGILVNSSQW